jgi:hypothetical protein
MKFNYSLIAAGVLAATSSHAALYQVVEVTPSLSVVDVDASQSIFTEYYGSAISKARNTSVEQGCFGQACASSASALAGDSRNGSEGHSYRQEVPYNYDSSFFYTDWGRNRDYCRSELGYQTCDPAWTDKMWKSFSSLGGLEKERDAWLSPTYTSNAEAFVNTAQIAAGQPVTGYSPDGFSYQNQSTNVVVNALDGDKAIGNTSSGYYTNGSNSALVYRHRGFYGNASQPTILNPLPQSGNGNSEIAVKEDKITAKMGRTMAFDSIEIDGKTYVTGSASVAPFDYGDSNKNYRGSVSNCINDTNINENPSAYADCQNFAFATKAALWDVSSANEGTPVEPFIVSNWQNTLDTVIDKKSPQGSVRGAVKSANPNVLTGEPVLVGLNTTRDGSNAFLQATVFTRNSNAIDSGNGWNSIVIGGSTIKSGDDFIYSSSVATDINENLLLIGEAKRRGDKRENGAAANRMFLAQVDANGNASAQYFDALNGNSGIFFRGVGGETGAINNFNEIVGAVDAEQSTEFFGKKRRQRGFIYPYSAVGSNTERMAIFQNQPWLLDDLTNDGVAKGADVNNQYRIIDAADINDDGIIAATALKCEGGYDTTGHNSYCGNGSQKEKLVAIKLIPISDPAARSIQTRGLEAPPVERKGGSLGWMALIFLGFIGLRRNK